MGQIGVGVSKRGFGGGSDKSIIVFGIPRMYTAIILYAASVFFVVKTSAIVSLVGAYIVGVGLVGLHASMRSPNLKVRLIHTYKYICFEMLHSLYRLRIHICQTPSHHRFPPHCTD